jgi:hypothetical protein
VRDFFSGFVDIFSVRREKKLTLLKFLRPFFFQISFLQKNAEGGGQTCVVPGPS